MGGASGRPGSVAATVRVTALVALAAVFALVGSARGPTASAAPVPGESAALDFDGVNDNVSFGNPASLRLSTFTVETWFMRQGLGKATTTTGASDVRGFRNITTDGIIPLVAKGRAEADKSTKDLNYVLGLHTSGVLGGDIEEGAASPRPGRNNKVLGTTVVPLDTWHHAALSYDGTTLTLYLDGVVEATRAVGRVPRSDSIQWASLGAALNSAGKAAGFFDGVLDDPRVWNRALSPAEVVATMAGSLTGMSGLVAWWNLNEGTGTVVGGPGGTTGVIRNGARWVDGRIPVPVNQPPAPPSLVSPSDGAVDVSVPASLSVSVSDPEAEPLDLTFYGRQVEGGGEQDSFSVAVLPDTQHYSESYPATYLAQTQWIVDHRDEQDIRFVAHLGDLVQNQDHEVGEWQVADAAHDTLDDAGVPYAVVPGNHDMQRNGVAAFFDAFFAPARFAGRPWYLGYLGDSLSGAAQGTGVDAVDDAGLDRLNKDNYQVVQAGGLRLVFINLEPDMPPETVAWAQRVIESQLAVDPDTEFVLVTHIFLDTPGIRRDTVWYRPDGMTAERVWQTLVRPSCSVHLVLSGHYHGEARRTDLNACGEPVHQVLADYQTRANGGDGWMRYLTFRPAEDAIDVVTYSPTLDQFETDANSQFTLSFAMGAQAGFEPIGAVDDVVSGEIATLPWDGLLPGTAYEWYAVASDGVRTTTGPRWTFTTAP